jgi:L-threonylcarbamoyladenylate synthase
MNTPYDKHDFDAALHILLSGGILLYPTDTVWGIGCDATNEEAVRKIFTLKQRADSKAMIVLMDSPLRLQKYVQTVPEAAWELIAASNTPENSRPITIIYPNAINLAPSLVADDGSIGIRLTIERFTQDLCAKLERPLVSTSANISGMPTPANFNQISEDIKDGVDYVCHYRRNDESKHRPSSIIKINNDNTFILIRQ